MNCEAYRSLLDRALDGAAAPRELEALEAHERQCPDCAALRLEMTRLQEELAGLRQDVPPMPEGFHEGWTRLVMEEAQSQALDPMEATPGRWPDKAENESTTRPRSKRRALPKAWTRALSVAAALVFVVGGTLLTRDVQSPAAYSLSQSARANSYNSYESSYVTGDTASGAPMLRMMESDDAGILEDAAEDLQESKIIRTVSLSFATRSYDEASELIRTSCQASGGYISWSTERVNTSNGARTSSLTLRIPAQRLDAFLNDISGAGRVTNRTESTEDVSASYYDTQARLETQKALMARLQSLVTDAANLTELLQLESQIADTQYRIDSLTASLQSTDHKVSYATVELSLREEKPADEITVPSLSLFQRMQSGLQAGLEALRDFLADMLVFVVTALPFLALAALALGAWRLIRRTWKKKKGNI